MGPVSHLCGIFLIIFYLSNVTSAGLRDLGMVQLKGSLGFGLRPNEGKHEGSGPSIKTYYGHGKGGLPKSANAAAAHSGSPNFVTACCKGKLKLFGQNIFGHGSIKGTLIKGHSPPHEGGSGGGHSYSNNKGKGNSGGGSSGGLSSGGGSGFPVTNYNHLHNNQGYHHNNNHDDEEFNGGGGNNNAGNSGGSLGSLLNEIHAHDHHGHDHDDHDHPIKFKNSYTNTQIKHRKYPKPVSASKETSERGSYPPKYNFKKYNTAGYGIGLSENEDEPPFWGNNNNNKGRGNSNNKPPLVIDGNNKGGSYQNHNNNDDDEYNGPPSHLSELFGPPPSSSRPSKGGIGNGNINSNFLSGNDEHNEHNQNDGYPNHNNHHSQGGYQIEPDFNKITDDDGTYHSHSSFGNFGPPQQDDHNNNNHDHHDQPPPPDHHSGGPNFRKHKSFDTLPPSSPFNFGQRPGPSRDFSSAKSAPPIQVIDHHHHHNPASPPPPQPFNRGSSHHSNSNYNPDHTHHSNPNYNQDHEEERFNNHVEDTKYPIFPQSSFASQSQSTGRSSGRNGYSFNTPKFRPIPPSPNNKPSSEQSLSATMTVSDQNIWMPNQPQTQPQRPKPKNNYGNPNKDFKYRVYEYGQNEVIIIDGGLKPHQMDVIRAHVYSKDEGKLLRTIEIKDAVKHSQIPIPISNRADTDTESSNFGLESKDIITIHDIIKPASIISRDESLPILVPVKAPVMTTTTTATEMPTSTTILTSTTTSTTPTPPVIISLDEDNNFNENYYPPTPQSNSIPENSNNQL